MNIILHISQENKKMLQMTIFYSSLIIHKFLKPCLKYTECYKNNVTNTVRGNNFADKMFFQ